MICFGNTVSKIKMGCELEAPQRSKIWKVESNREGHLSSNDKNPLLAPRTETR